MTVKPRGALHIVPLLDSTLRTASGYRVTYRRDGSAGPSPHARQLASTADLCAFLEDLGVELSDPMVRAALGELYARGSTSIPEVCLTDEELVRHRL